MISTQMWRESQLAESKMLALELQTYCLCISSLQIDQISLSVLNKVWALYTPLKFMRTI